MATTPLQASVHTLLRLLSDSEQQLIDQNRVIKTLTEECKRLEHEVDHARTENTRGAESRALETKTENQRLISELAAINAEPRKIGSPPITLSSSTTNGKDRHFDFESERPHGARAKGYNKFTLYVPKDLK